tara:strand:- start:7838 stop:9004 length:1167 start_codon:yes stop_codon:yes gene_type:complete
MSVKLRDLVFFAPIFFVCLFGREYRGVGLETIIVSCSIVLFCFRFTKTFLVRDYSFLIAFWVALVGGVGSYLVSNFQGDERFIFENSLEDLYAVLVFLFFYGAGLSVDPKDNDFWGKLRIVLGVALVLNLLACFLYYGSDFRYTYFQRLWNPYLFALLVISHFASKTLKSLIWLIPFSAALFVFSTSFQMSAVFLLLIISVIFGNRLVGALNDKILGVGVVSAVLSLLCFSLYIDPFVLAEIDHNFGVRAVFWREALAEFLVNPWGFKFGVSVVSGDMSAINESAFHGGREYVDLGVHSGFMSLLYKLGLIGLPFLILIFRPAFSLKYVGYESRKGYLIVMFSCYLSLFSNDSFFTPHFSAALGFVLGLYSCSRLRSNMSRVNQVAVI